MTNSHEGPNDVTPFDAEAFAQFRADPKRQALVRRILADGPMFAVADTVWVKDRDQPATVVEALPQSSYRVVLHSGRVIATVEANLMAW